MSKPEMTPKQQSLVKARQAARVVFALLLFGGSCLILIGISTAYLPNILNGAVLIAGSVVCYAFSKMIEKKLSVTLT